MKTIELFSGTGSFSKVAKARGHSIFRVEKDTHFEAEVHCDILNLSLTKEFNDVDILWASPPCTCFSVASIGSSWWCGSYHPKRTETALGMAYVLKTLEIIKKIKPKYWFIENPRGVMRKMAFLQDFHRRTVTYCQYGDNRMKPTDIWTNFTEWKSRPMCKNGMSCHVSAPRGSKTGTQGLKNARDRSVIPFQLMEEIIEQIEKVQKL
jgi:site-specific DNA-cytosine methylase|tara:strand:- start:232 stop:855 length:624 start_codon:yes stop_codon:yes gene_type:complete